MAFEGGCLCGAIRYACAEDPIASYLCHCTDCQRNTGSAFAACTIVARAALRITRGTPREFARTAESGRVVQRWFCADCGSPLYSSASANADWRVLRMGTLDDPSGCVPQLHIWTDSAHPWALPDDGAPRRPRGRDSGPER